VGEAPLSPAELTKEIAEHAEHTNHTESHGWTRTTAIAESLLLAVVALLAA
jgi:hypothetical protein